MSRTRSVTRRRTSRAGECQKHLAWFIFIFFLGFLTLVDGTCMLFRKGGKELPLYTDSIEIPTRCSFVIEFIIPKFIEGSTCFERHTAHHQEL